MGTLDCQHQLAIWKTNISIVNLQSWLRHGACKHLQSVCMCNEYRKHSHSVQPVQSLPVSQKAAGVQGQQVKSSNWFEYVEQMANIWVHIVMFAISDKCLFITKARFSCIYPVRSWYEFPHELISTTWVLIKKLYFPNMCLWPLVFLRSSEEQLGFRGTHWSM